jgi:cation diffusion facilitator CzcD-associated flavoprotein CzcO
MRITQSQPTVSATLVHHVARGSVTLRPNIKQISSHSAEFDDGSTVAADAIVFATGYKISFPFLSPEIASQVLPRPAANGISLYHNVFHPKYCSYLAHLLQPFTVSVPLVPAALQRLVQRLHLTFSLQHRCPRRVHRAHPAILRRSITYG